MTVGELIEMLQVLDPTTKIVKVGSDNDEPQLVVCDLVPAPDSEDRIRQIVLEEIRKLLKPGGMLHRK